jgi:hypothetical protein
MPLKRMPLLMHRLQRFSVFLFFKIAFNESFFSLFAFHYIYFAEESRR